MKRMACLAAALMMAVSGAGAEMLTEEQIPEDVQQEVSAEVPEETAAGEGQTADEREADLLDLWETDGDDRRWITAAVQVMDGMLMTPWALLPEKTEGLTVSDGENEWEVKAVIPDSTGMTAIVFFDPSQQLPRKGPWLLMTYGESAEASECVIRCGNTDGGRRNCRVLSAAETEWMESRCLLLSVEEEVPIGSAVLTPGGELAGMVIADYAEGQNRVLALPAEEVVRGMSEAGMLLGVLASWGNPPEGYRVTTEQNLVTFDWSQMTMPEKAEGEELYLLVMDAGNSYLTFYPAETEERRISLILTPGRVYISGIIATAGHPSTLPDQYEVTVMPPARKMTEYSFRPILTAIAEIPEGAQAGQEPEPVSEVTEELLRSGRAYFYSVSAYEVTERIEGKTLLVTLTDPAGINYRYESSWVYDPEYMTNDIWYIPLTGSPLTYSLDQGGYPKGEYHVGYYVDGELADEITFELK